MLVDLYLTNGQIADPGSGTVRYANVAIDNGIIRDVSEPGNKNVNARQVIDLRGRIITPALIDCHVHVFNAVKPTSVDPDQIGVQQGVLAVGDAGSFGPANAEGFKRFIVDQAQTDVYGFVHIARYGNSRNPGESAIASHLSVDDVVDVIEEHRDWVCGVKVRASVSAVGPTDILAVKMAKEAASEAGVPLMVHIGNAPPVVDDVLDLLTEGDIVTHCFHGKIGGLVTRQGQLLEAAHSALERGVLFDIGHGSGSFCFDTAERAFELGLPLQIISTDLHRGNINGPVYSQVWTMTKLLALVGSLIDVILASSTHPAQAMGITKKYGSICEGAPANLSVIEVQERQMTLTDSYRKTRQTSKVIAAVATVREGQYSPVSDCGLSDGRAG